MKIEKVSRNTLQACYECWCCMVCPPEDTHLQQWEHHKCSQLIQPERKQVNKLLLKLRVNLFVFHMSEMKKYWLTYWLLNRQISASVSVWKTLYQSDSTAKFLNCIISVHCYDFSLTWTDASGYRSWLVLAFATHGAVCPTVGHHRHPDVLELGLLHPAHIPAHLHGRHPAFRPAVGEISLHLFHVYRSASDVWDQSRDTWDSPK